MRVGDAAAELERDSPEDLMQHLLAPLLLASLVACRAETRPGNRASAQDSAVLDAPVTGADDARWTVTARGIGPQGRFRNQ